MNKKVVVSVIIIAVMVLGGLGISLDQESNEIESGGTRFIQTDKGYMTEYNGKNYYFSLLPDDVSYINVSSSTKNALRNKAVVLTYNTEDELATAISAVQYEILENIKDKYVVMALTNATNYKVPEATCANATASQTIVLMQYGNASIQENNNCVIVQADDEREMINYGARIEYELWEAQKTQ